MCMTATASPQVHEDVCRVLRTRNALILQSSFNRPNLRFEVVEKPQGLDSSIRLVRKIIQERFSDEKEDCCGIVYCLAR